MSLVYEDLSSGYKGFQISDTAKKQLKTLYSREFLLSFSELVICKKLPSGFDPSILSEFEDAFHGVQERQRPPVASQLQGYKRSEYSSSPPTRGDSGSYSRSSYGRWDSRSSGRSDRDSDSHSDKDSDPGRHHANPSQQPWKSSEHDGLLGSGTFPKPGYGSWNSSQKSGVTDDDQLNRNNGPYHPPRPYKAAPYPRRETKDSYNDETFGSTEGANEDKVEEERQRRASFELMRKEQHKVLEEKQKLNEKPTVDFRSGISKLLEDMKEETRDLGGSDMLHKSSTTSILVNDPIKSSILSQTTTSRPLVPPGFTNTIGEKYSTPKPTVHAHKIEIAKAEPEEVPLHFQKRSYGTLDWLARQSSRDHSSGDHILEDRSSLTLLDKGTEISSPYSFAVSEPKTHMGDNLFSTSTSSETNDFLYDPEVVEVIPKVLENIFGSTSPIDASSSATPAELPDDTWTNRSDQSSKFARWFFEEDRKPGEDLKYSRPNDLLSLIVGGDKGMSQPSDEKYMGHFPSENFCKSSEFTSETFSGLSSKPDDISTHQCESSKTEAIPSVLTCEDLEQTILSEYSDKSPSLPLTEQLIQCSSVSDTKSEQPRGKVDNHASQQLLSLLHKDTGLNKMQSGPNMESHLNCLSPSNAWNMQAALGETSEEGLKINPVSSSPTLETLFGSAFMRELQSAEAPVSIQRGSVESVQTEVSENLGFPFPLVNEGSTHTVTNEVGQKSTSLRGSSLPLNPRQDSRSESWSGISTSVDEPGSLKSLFGNNSRHSDFLKVDRCQLPEEERFFTNGQSSSGAPVITVENSAAIGAVAGEESSRIVTESSPLVHSHNRTTEIPCGNLYDHPLPPQFQNPVMSHERPLPFPLDSHPARMNSHMKFMGPESIIHRGPSANHQLPANVGGPNFHQSSSRVTVGNNNSHNSILQQMQISGNRPPQLLHGFQNTVLPHPTNQSNELIRELSLIPGFPFGLHHPYNMSGSGLPIPAPNINNLSNHPEAFQRLLKMELRAKSNQIHTPPGHSPAMYNNELNHLGMHLPYR